MSEITLFDLPSREPCQSWSANALKTRIALNYKHLSYKTEWVPYIKLAETLKKTGFEKNPPGSWADYTVPAVKLADGRLIMDSALIAPELEKLQPEPSLRLDESPLSEIQEAMSKLFPPIAAVFGPLLPLKILVEEDIDWFNADRAQRFRMSLQDLEREKGGEVGWNAAREGFGMLEKVLRGYKKDSGPFILGSQPCYGDFVILASAHMLVLCGEEAGRRYLDGAEGLRELYEAGKGWCVTPP